MVESRVPAIRALAQEFKVSNNTVAGALRILETENFIRINRGKGAFVCLPEMWNENFGAEDSSPDPLLENVPAPEPVLHFLFHLDKMGDVPDSFGSEFLSFYTSIICIMQEEADKIKWRLRIGDAAKSDEIIRHATTENTRGVIYMPDKNHTRDLKWPELKFPQVLFSIGEKNLFTNYVTPDNYSGGCLAARYLLPITKKQLIVCADYNMDNYLGVRPYRERIQGFSDICKMLGRPEPEVLRLKDFRDIKDIFDRVMPLPADERPGILFPGDSFLVNEIQSAFKAYFPQFKFGKDIKVAANVDFSDPSAGYEFAAIGFSRRALCREVIDLVRRAAMHPADTPIRVKIPMKLYVPEENGDENNG